VAFAAKDNKAGEFRRALAHLCNTHVCSEDDALLQTKALLSMGLDPNEVCSALHCTAAGLARTLYIYAVYDRIYGDFPAKKIVYTPFAGICDSGQPYTAALTACASEEDALLLRQKHCSFCGP
jgi:hypothetical protein